MIWQCFYYEYELRGKFFQKPAEWFVREFEMSFFGFCNRGQFGHFYTFSVQKTTVTLKLIRADVTKAL
ncbi:MAG: hypothetical protein D6778_07435 [Nitrospirae bacterium]|nr:MAG: hypothetical protein D6778_07435 [Nitrospirota bacterium]